jgi:hypothetical protein
MTEQSYTDAQLDGYACIKCGERGGVMVPAGDGPRGQLFQHETCPSPDQRVSADNPQLSATNGPTARSDDDIAEAIGRMIAALGRRCAAGDPDTAQLLRYLHRELQEAFDAGVAGWRAAGFSDAQIGRELGVTKQAVQKRWPRPERIT